jgi:uncharacterized protein
VTDSVVNTPLPEKPLPVITDLNRPFWEATKQGELRVQQCSDCHFIRYPINPVCTSCLSPRFEWLKLAGSGTVFSTVVYHHVFSQAFRDDVPYNVSIVQLDEGIRMWSNVTDVPADSVKVGDRVTVWFDRVNDEVTVPRFRPVS